MTFIFFFLLDWEKKKKTLRVHKYYVFLDLRRKSKRYTYTYIVKKQYYIMLL